MPSHDFVFGFPVTPFQPFQVQLPLVVGELFEANARPLRPAPSHYNMVYDSYSLKMQSCLGWSEEALEAEQAFLTREAYAQGGQTGDFFWVFPPPGKCF